MQIEDMISEYTVHLNTDNPFKTANNILVDAAKLGIVTVIKNEFLTNGPESVVEMDFVLSQHADIFTSAILNVSVQGNQKKGFLEISLESKTNMVIKETGFFCASMASYYMEKNYSDVSKRAQKLASNLEKSFQDMLGRVVA
ncbi:MAG TPA: hypothetical protein VI968_02310 [archaeon]|nr:hypothetical protein [archaeon]